MLASRIRRRLSASTSGAASTQVSAAAYGASRSVHSPVPQASSRMRPDGRAASSAADSSPISARHLPVPLRAVIEGPATVEPVVVLRRPGAVVRHLLGDGALFVAGALRRSTCHEELRATEAPERAAGRVRAVPPAHPFNGVSAASARNASPVSR